ncbi:MAG: metal-dependent hydrolase [Negativicutes bacterium]|nr:metal-dependent hydrolase [Negativicutes bacterium]
MLTHGDTRLVFDPWFTGNPWKAAAADEIDCQYILVSHAHQDHLGDTAAIATRTGAKVITISALARVLKEQGCDASPMDIGGKRFFDFGYVRLTPAVHGSGIAGGQAAGFIVKFYGTTIYFAGDTALFGDMALLARLEKIDYALLPIGDNYTMGPADAVEAVGMLKPRVVIPMHYNSNPLIMQSPEDFKKAVEGRYGITTIVMQPGMAGTIILQ